MKYFLLIIITIGSIPESICAQSFNRYVQARIKNEKLAILKTDDGDNKPILGADLTVPTLGTNGLKIIPAPSFEYNTGDGGFNIYTFGTAIAQDTIFDGIATGFLVPRKSAFGIILEKDLLWTSEDEAITKNTVVFGCMWQAGFLSKKFSYFDRTSLTTLTAGPFVFQARFGLNQSIHVGKFSSSFYVSSLTVLSDNNSFEKLFATTKKTFVYPGLDLTYFQNIDSDGKKSFKVELGIIGNTMRSITHTNDNAVVTLNISFNTKL